MFADGDPGEVIRATTRLRRSSNQNLKKPSRFNPDKVSWPRYSDSKLLAGEGMKNVFAELMKAAKYCS